MSVKTFLKGCLDLLSINFKAKEFDCKCNRCTTTFVDVELVETLQKIRTHFGLPLNITSGYRCPEHNTEVGGAKASYHMKGMAADIYINGVTPIEIAQYAESINVRGIGRYSSFVHIDTRPVKYYWENLGNGEKAVTTHGTNTLKPDVQTKTPYGRLYIDSVNINVGLYNDNKQETTDAEDSANYYMDSKGGAIIADHNNQAFKTLKNVSIGDIAKITTDKGTVIYKCVEAIDGHNTGTDITDNNNNSLYGKHKLLMYTCKENWQNVVIRMFEETQYGTTTTTPQEYGTITTTPQEPVDGFIDYIKLANEIAADVKESVLKRLQGLFVG